MERKIKLLRKERNRERKSDFNIQSHPAQKKRKLGSGKYKTVKQWLQEERVEKREREDPEYDIEEKKKFKKTDECEDLTKMRKKNPIILMRREIVMKRAVIGMKKLENILKE